MQPTANKISAYFISHSPLLAIEQTEYASFLEKLITNKPKAIIIFSAHWETPITTISSITGTYDTIYDFSGFPKELYKIKYPAKGSPELALKISKILNKNGIETALNEKRGLDHSSWTVLSRIFPNADVPVIQMSVNADMGPKAQFEIGKALRELDDEIMVIGSGGTVHNLRRLDLGSTKPEKWAVEFDDWLIEAIKNKDYNALCNYRKLAPYGNEAVNSGEHFAPFMIVAGCSDPGVEAKVLHREYRFGSISYLCYKFA